MKKILTVFAVFLIGAAVGYLFSESSDTVKAQTEDAAGITKVDYESQIVARFGNAVITRGELAENAIYRSGGTRLILGELLDQAIVRNAAMEAGISATPEEVEAEYQEALFLAECNNAKNAFLSKPKAISMANIESLFLLGKLLNITATDEEAYSYYTSPAAFIIPDQVNLIWITTDTKASADSAVKQLKEGYDPAEVTAKYSNDPVLIEKGGYTGWRNRNTFNSEVAELIFEAKNGLGLQKDDIGGPIIISKYGENMNVVTEYLVVYIVDIDRAKKRPYEQVWPGAKYAAKLNKISDMSSKFFLDEIGKYNYRVKSNIFDPSSSLVYSNIDTRQLEEDLKAVQNRAKRQ